MDYTGQNATHGRFKPTSEWNHFCNAAEGFQSLFSGLRATGMIGGAISVARSSIPELGCAEIYEFLSTQNLGDLERVTFLRETQSLFDCRPETCGQGILKVALSPGAKLEFALSQPNMEGINAWVNYFQSGMGKVRVVAKRVPKQGGLRGPYIWILLQGLSQPGLHLRTSAEIDFHDCPELESISIEPFPTSDDLAPAYQAARFLRCPNLRSVSIGFRVHTLAFTECPALCSFPSSDSFGMDELALRGVVPHSFKPGGLAPKGLRNGGQVHLISSESSQREILANRNGILMY